MEMLSIVNDNDEVIGEATRPDIYANKYRHRIAHVLVFNDQKQMLLQKRSANLSYCPDHWSTAVGGHVAHGETYEDAAKRECTEEIGVTLPLTFFAKDDYESTDAHHAKFLCTFTASFNGPFNPDPNEVSAVGFFSIEEIKAKVAQGEKFHPELLYLLKKYYF